MSEDYKFQTCTEEEIKELAKKTFQSKLNKIPIIGKRIYNKNLKKFNDVIIKEVNSQIDDETRGGIMKTMFTEIDDSKFAKVDFVLKNKNHKEYKFK